MLNQRLHEEKINKKCHQIVKNIFINKLLNILGYF